MLPTLRPNLPAKKVFLEKKRLLSALSSRLFGKGMIHNLDEVKCTCIWAKLSLVCCLCMCGAGCMQPVIRLKPYGAAFTKERLAHGGSSRRDRGLNRSQRVLGCPIATLSTSIFPTSCFSATSYSLSVPSPKYQQSLNLLLSSEHGLQHGCLQQKACFCKQRFPHTSSTHQGTTEAHSLSMDWGPNERCKSRRERIWTAS
jgi:hypothetical protein